MNLDPAVLRNMFLNTGLVATVVSELSDREISKRVRVLMEGIRQLQEYQGKNPRPLPLCEKYIRGVIRGGEIPRECRVCEGRRSYCGYGIKIPVII